MVWNGDNDPQEYPDPREEEGPTDDVLTLREQLKIATGALTYIVNRNYTGAATVAGDALTQISGQDSAPISCCNCKNLQRLVACTECFWAESKRTGRLSVENARLRARIADLEAAAEVDESTIGRLKSESIYED